MKDRNAEQLTIIGIGSSAGGLEAIRELVATLPSDVPVTYVVVQHMSPNHKSLMTELVARETSLEVKDVEDGIEPQPNTIYVTPPKTDVIFSAGKLHLIQPSPELSSPKPSVDRFLSSLADSHGEHTVAVILSGTGTDGAYGVQAIREAGGITIAQDRESAKYDGMPTAAVQTGCVDLILSPLDIGTHLTKILSSPRDFDAFRRSEVERSPLSSLLQILLARTRVDFREYKQTTVGRRIERRMLALGIDNQDDYVEFCRDNPSAVDALFKDLLISVTRFFRDRAQFEQLNAMLPKLIDADKAGPLRVWIAGCATGEEAYSIAILFAEALGGPKVILKNHVQIFATDIDREALQVARRGSYGLAALNDIPDYLADQYLLREKDGVRVIDNVRSAVLFSEHNVCQDPPFQNIDLICCRNLLIYFGNNLQQKVMSRFHYSMKATSLLFLGTAESVAGSDDLFIQDTQASHIYRKRSIKRVDQAPISGRRFGPANKRISPPDEEYRAETTDRQLFEALAMSLGQNSILVTDDFSIARVYGEISKFIEVKSTTSLKMHLDLLRSPLREEARSLITLSLKHNEPRSGVRHLLAEGDDATIRLDVYPIIAKAINESAALLVFKPMEADRRQLSEGPVQADEDDVASERIRSLESEVATTREALQQTIEELETSNEELQSLNEELQSTNEELQATNEELETSNEELQSTNEELITVNEELQVTAAELTARSSELTSVLESAPFAMLVVDNALQVSHATNAAIRLFDMQLPISSPHVSQCKLPDGFPSFAPICNEALRLGQSVKLEFSSGGARVMLNCSPYFDPRGQILGVTMVISDFPGLARELETILNNTELMIMNRTADGKILRISSNSAKAMKTTRAQAEGSMLSDFLDEETTNSILSGDRSVLDGEKDHSHETYQIRAKNEEKSSWVKLDRIIHRGYDWEEPSIYAIGTDVSDEIYAAEEARLAYENMAKLQDFAETGFWSIDLEQDRLQWSPEVYRLHGVTPGDFKPSVESALSFYSDDHRDELKSLLDRVREEGGEFRKRLSIVQADGAKLDVEILGLAQRDEADKVVQIMGFFRRAATGGSGGDAAG
ncbi:chemotaxis protein CheB [Thalassococcus sp. S3]|uniref:chemotaxis protein CheB n=1 Tax=Thalassococcus sp. S3 TaxID=2017482 RepID=UPI00102443AC|nr:chemotaxis protein CheB [Thalassococcus sp. S3]QBF30553.1 PAS domain S-box protein [Thalassococcus sp. S3]